jgi:SAM-dependent methyltransferase
MAFPVTSDAGWLGTPLGLALLDLETVVIREALHDVFGFELLQVGHWGPADALMRLARTQHSRWIAPDASGHGAIRASYDCLPIASGSVEAVLLPHTLEQGERPHEVLREVERVLTGDGSVVICGFNPLGPWGARHLMSRGRFPPPARRMLTEHRIRDWLRLLGFEVGAARHFLFCPPWTQGVSPRVRAWLETRSGRLMTPLAGAYLLKARKRVRALTPIRPQWRRAPALVGGLAEPTSRNAA